MKRLIILLFLSFVLSQNLSAQSTDSLIIGNVSFKNATNVYVRFSSTAQISIGDTLLLKTNAGFMPCLVVAAKSSISCVTTPINGCDIAQDAKVVFRFKLSNKPKQPADSKENSKDTISPKKTNEPINSIKIKDTKKTTYTQKINGRVTLASYTSFSNLNPAALNSLTGRFSLNVDHIKNSKLSFETYLNYRQNVLSKEAPSGYQTKFFRVYNLALKYDVTKNLNVSVGRKINNKIASVGAIDGLQSEATFGKFFTGAVVGFRPDIFDYGFNSKLLQLGAYGGYSIGSAKKYYETTLGIIEQKNGKATDRRYTYLQHTNRINDKISMFSSLELDLFENINGNTGTKARLTSFYYSLNYQPIRKLSLMASYDSRKNIIYYESFLGNEIDRLLADDINMQGIRLRINYKLTRKIYSGVSFSNRFQADGQNKSNNFYAFITHSKLPWVGGNLNLNANLNYSNYMESKILALRYNRDIFKQKLNFSTYYRIVDYKYVNKDIAKSLQHYIGTDFSFNYTKNYSFHLMGEFSIRGAENNYRINFSVTKRIR